VPPSQVYAGWHCRPVASMRAFVDRGCGYHAMAARFVYLNLRSEQAKHKQHRRTRSHSTGLGSARNGTSNEWQSVFQPCTIQQANSQCFSGAPFAWSLPSLPMSFGNSAARKPLFNSAPMSSSHHRQPSHASCTFLETSAGHLDRKDHTSTPELFPHVLWCW
jgi:hypothetical protein